MMENNQLQISTLVGSDLGEYGISVSLSQCGRYSALFKGLSIHLPGEKLTQQPIYQVFLNLMMEHCSQTSRDRTRLFHNSWLTQQARVTFPFCTMHMYPSFLLHLYNPQDSSLLISPAVHTSTHICMDPPNEVL